ncbi:hypothetical protein BDN72DRAFT_864823 [Pluteus cervinus]|uniref:Uncharacterized protein n=1 Tax=Pluteus cervinus TaxID=181527 RepID=A0ACD3A388_9AGAR|nr:hypothetical protein BDN72DRAFT_864823 [Pluteus cervinus]
MEAYLDNKTNVLNAQIRTSHDDMPIYSIITTSGLRGRRMTVLKDLNPLPGDSVVVGVIHWQAKTFEIRGIRHPIKEMKRKKAKDEEVNVIEVDDRIDEDDGDEEGDGDEDGDEDDNEDEDEREEEEYHTRQRRPGERRVRIKDPEDDDDASTVKPTPQRPQQHQQQRQQHQDPLDRLGETVLHHREAAGKWVKTVGLPWFKSVLHHAHVRMWRWSPTRREYAITYSHEQWRAILLKPSNTGDERTNIVAARFYVPCRPHLFGKPAPTKLYLSRTALEADEVFLMLTFIYSEARRQDRTSSSSDMGW